MKKLLKGDRVQFGAGTGTVTHIFGPNQHSEVEYYRIQWEDPEQGSDNMLSDYLKLIYRGSNEEAT